MAEISEPQYAAALELDVRTFRKYAAKWGLKPVRKKIRIVRYYDDADLSRVKKLIPRKKGRGHRLVERP
jgi:DNA-binding transcriptional MerR regulator